ncbi:hypothetical protein FB451DRAFT_1549113, partial [Mycena latifolia]
MHPFSLPALLVALLSSFSPAVLFSVVHPVPHLQVPYTSYSPPIAHTTNMLDIQKRLDALELPVHDHSRLSFDATAFLSTYTPVELDASIFIGTALDAGEKSFSMVHYVATSAPLSAAVYPASSLLTVMLVLIALRMAVPRVCEDLEFRVRAFDVRRAAHRVFIVAFCLCRIVVAVDVALGRALVLAVLGAVDLVLAIDLAIERAAVRGYEELEEVHSADERRCRPDRARALTDTPATPPRTSTRDRTCSAPGHLVLVPAAPTAAGAAVWRVVRVVPPIAPIAPS